MAYSKRGPERRRIATDRSANPSSAKQAWPDDRRMRPERRRNGYISKLELCRGLSYDQVESVFDLCPVKILNAGDVLLEPGQTNHYLYFILSGRLDVRLKSAASPVADTIGVGETVGEMSIIDGKPTSAHVSAGEASTVIAVHQDVFWSKIATSPTTVRNLSRILAERMRKRNELTLRALEQELRFEQLQNELKAAHEIQVGMLPPGPNLIPECDAVEVIGRMDVVKSVGGDLYDAFYLDDDRICVAIGDVSSKGTPAALFMVRTATLLRAELSKTNGLAESVSQLNARLCDINIPNMFVSLIVMVIDLTNGKATYVIAGHPPLLASLGGQPWVDIGAPAGLIAGVLDDTVYETGGFTLRPGDRLVLYTDGVTEARDEDRNFYTQSRLREFLSDLETRDASVIVEAIFTDVASFSGRMQQSDDITVVAVKYLGHRG
ncbi:MAG: SpoIIE family protein phosphatase [Gammaproteobacteria bacterium]|nr:SpoIIE family protein phosphatase [Gammaproteobacteria bacterium]